LASVTCYLQPTLFLSFGEVLAAYSRFFCIKFDAELIDKYQSYCLMDRLVRICGLQEKRAELSKKSCAAELGIVSCTLLPPTNKLHVVLIPHAVTAPASFWPHRAGAMPFLRRLGELPRCRFFRGL
jgi:hypothetical protein